MSRLVLVVLLLIGLIGIAVFLGEPEARQPFAVAPTSPVPEGGYATVSRNTLRGKVLREYAYEPSKAARSIAKRQASGSRNWYQFAPSGSTAAPLVILFHGAGRSGLSMIDMWKEVAQQNDILLLAPNTGGKNWQLQDFDQLDFDIMLAALERNRPVDRNRIYLFGHSSGALMANWMNNRLEGPWRAAAVHGGNAQASDILPNAQGKPFRIYLGDQDHIFSVENAEATGRAMARAGHVVTVNVIPNHTHWFYEIGPQIAHDSWRWFDQLPR
ncbi:hypothetical protein GG681_01980 [Epibacterium sp. SM1969]|uniref:Dienelactone hydrolase domain-containing protein n=1 Tax=Tritonibacter aquimaris TaxID=2663379 RepID=A0A844AW16_9RHOB|nr:dienelactone hydrolase family protein [Tritonibacter aquimaris]MQY41396.1 hypothetical protein [Tritonibacter aquimaris]